MGVYGSLVFVLFSSVQIHVKLFDPSQAAFKLYRFGKMLAVSLKVIHVFMTIIKLYQNFDSPYGLFFFFML